MFWITKWKHNNIVEQYRKSIDDLREALWRKEKFEEICEKLTDKTNNLGVSFDTAISCGQASAMDQLDETVAIYVDDYFGGKVIKQESHPVTILDEEGKATYAVTGRKLPKGQTYHLVTD